MVASSFSPPPPILISGSNGFVGKHMARYLLGLGKHVVGIGRSADSRFQHKCFQYVSCDITSQTELRLLLEHYQFEYIIHLAGDNDVRTSYQDPVQAMQSNVFGTMKLLEAARTSLGGVLKGILTVGTGYEYHIQSCPLSESSELAPASPYAWSKLLTTSLCRMYGQIYKLPVIVARTFNLIGPGCSAGVCPGLIRQVVQMELGHVPPKLITGDVSVHRDFLDVRDACAAYWLLLQMNPIPSGDVYNVCSGQTHSIRSIAAILQKHTRISFDITVDESLLRSKDPPFMQGDNTRIVTDTEWKPCIPFEQSITDALEEHRNLVKGRFTT